LPRYDLLSGVRVLDLSHALAGPFGSQILADLGAEVIKIEPPFVGDGTRLLFPRIKDDGYYFLALNRNKKSITLDLQTPTGRRAFDKLVAVSDVFYTNFRYKTIENRGLTHDDLSKINPAIISAYLTGFGTSGAYRDHKAFDDVGQAMSGIASLTTDASGAPVRTAVGSADISTAAYAVIAVLAALHKRKETGKGERIEINMLDTCMAFIPQLFQFYFISGQAPRTGGSKHPAIAGFGYFKTKDGYVAIGPGWPRVTRAVGRSELADDPRFIEREDRFINKDILNAEIEGAMTEIDSQTWAEILVTEDIPAGPVLTLDQVENDPQVKHNRMIQKLDDPARGEIKIIDSPIKIPSAAEHPHEVPPPLGKHTAEVLTSLLGYSEEDLKVLEQEAEAHHEELITNSVNRML